jgi:two-component system cell cycle sensor histidine kinase/response regulator CckA
MFDPRRLTDDRDFDSRLATLLDEARAALALDWIGIAEIAAPDGRAELGWRVVVPVGPKVPDSLPERSRHQPHEPCAVPLDVEPALGAGAGAWLVYASARAPSTAHVDELCTAIEIGLEDDRRRRLGEIALEAMSRAADALELTDREARLLFVNDAWERLFGYRRQEALGRTVGELFRDRETPQHDPSFYRFSLQSIETDGAWFGMVTSRAKNGEHVHCEVAASPFEADDSRVLGNFAIRRDLRHRRDREAALTSAHREFRAVLASIPDAVVVVRSERIYFVNAAFLTIVGEDEVRAIGRPITDFVHGGDRESFESGLPIARTSVRLLRSDGSARLVDLSSAGSISFEGAPAAILVGRDRTDQRIAEEQLARAEKLSALGSLAAGVAHEINNPLAYVILNLELLASGTKEGALSAVSEALDGAHRIKRIAAELRMFSREDGGGSELGPTDLEQAVTSALNLTQNLIRHRARLARTHDPGLLASIGERPLVQALVNLLTNAAEAIPDELEIGAGPEAEHCIAVESSATGDRVAIRVSDTGVGIAREQQPHLFDPFYTTKPLGQGTGLGLAITRRIAEHYGGRVEVESTVGRGTTFTIWLPRAYAAAADAPSDDGIAARERLRILIVDDDVAVARALRRILAHHEVEQVADGRTARERLLSSDSFDVVICDLMMPGMSGIDVYRAVSSERPSVADRFLFMTGGTFTGPAVQFVAERPELVLQKPFDAATIRARVTAVGARLRP